MFSTPPFAREGPILDVNTHGRYGRRKLSIYLVIPQAQISEQTIVFQHIVSELLHLWLVLEMEVSLQETFVQLDDLT